MDIPLKLHLIFIFVVLIVWPEFPENWCGNDGTRIPMTCLFYKYRYFNKVFTPLIKMLHINYKLIKEYDNM